MYVYNCPVVDNRKLQKFNDVWNEKKKHMYVWCTNIYDHSVCKPYEICMCIHLYSYIHMRIFTLYCRWSLAMYIWMCVSSSLLLHYVAAFITKYPHCTPHNRHRCVCVFMYITMFVDMNSGFFKRINVHLRV